MIALIFRDAMWISAILATFLTFRALYQRKPKSALHPVLCSTFALVLLLVVTQHPLPEFQAETRPLVWLLGPAVVAMALPVWQKRALIVENWRMFGAVLIASFLLSVATVFALTPLLGSDMARALAVKSVTAPVALGIGGQTGLRQDLVVIGVMTSGLFGMVIGPALLAWSRLYSDHSVIGAALGCASHGLGTARAFEISQTAGAFASVCMGLSALSYGILLPIVLNSV